MPASIAPGQPPPADRRRPTAAGFPGIVHGGAQFTVLDCMAGWAAFILRNDTLEGIPLRTSATMRFMKAARVAYELRLYAEIAREADGKMPSLIKTGIMAPVGEVLSQADYEYVLVPQDKFKRVAAVSTNCRNTTSGHFRAARQGPAARVRRHDPRRA